MARSPNNKTAQRRLLSIVRQRKALQWALAGLTQQEIANRFGSEINPETGQPYGRVCQQRVSQMLQDAVDELERDVAVDADGYRTLQKQDIMAALQVMRTSLFSRYAGERMAAADRIPRLWARLSSLYGLDAPNKTDITSARKRIGGIIVIIEHTSDDGGDTAQLPPADNIS